MTPVDVDGDILLSAAVRDFYQHLEEIRVDLVTHRTRRYDRVNRRQIPGDQTATRSLRSRSIARSSVSSFLQKQNRT